MKAILFDFDDTLVQTKQSKWAALIETAQRHYGLDIDNEHIAQFWGTPFEEMLTGVMKNADSFENLKDSYFSVTTEFPMTAHTNAVIVLNKLVENYNVGIVTASNRTLVIDDLKRLRFPVDQFFHIQTAEDTEVHKPNPDVFLPTLAKKPELQAADFLYVGDSMRDYLAARDAGMQFIGISHDDKSEFADQDMQYVTSFNELLNLIKSSQLF